jgi:DNA polymerase elongation subunit (family B)
MKHILKECKPGEKANILSVVKYSNYFHGGEYKNDVLYITYKDKNNNKHVQAIPSPKQEIFFTKPEYRNDWKYVRDSKHISLLDPVMVEPRGIPKRIYEELKDHTDEESKRLKRVYEESFNMQKGYRVRKEMNKWQHAFFSDLDIEDSYMINMCLQQDTSKTMPIKRSFFDIETATYGLEDWEWKKAHKDPVIWVTYITDYDIHNPSDTSVRTVNCFILRDYKKYPQQKEFEANIKKFEKQCHIEYDKIEVTVAEKTVTYDNKYNYNFMFFDRERELLESYFSFVHGTDPDILASWNGAEFDNPKLIGRMKENNLNPTDLYSHPSIPSEARMLDVVIDRRDNIGIENKSSYVKSSSRFLNIDMMLLYAGMTKGAKKSGGYSLDNVLKNELGIGKAKFPNNHTIVTAPIYCYWEFALYSIKDVILLIALDDFKRQLSLLLLDINTSACLFENTTKPTKQGRNYYHFQKYRRWQMIAGNNEKVDYIGGMDDVEYEKQQQQLEYIRKYMEENDLSYADKDDKTIEEDKKLYHKLYGQFEDEATKVHALGGGIVGDPTLLVNAGEEIIPGIKSNAVWRWLLDFDYASEYPWAKITRNLGKETEIGRLIISKRISERQNPFNKDIYLPGAEFISDYISEDYISMGNVYFSLPSSQDLIKEAMAYEEELLRAVN